MKAFNPREQEQVFIEQLGLAAERNLPVTIHCLKAWGRLLEILQSERRPAVGFLLHSYGGSLEMAHCLAELGGYFSLSGYFAHSRKAAQREVFRRIPRDRLLLETDAPDMLPPPEWNRDPLNAAAREINSPLNIVPVYEFAAALLAEKVEALAAVIEQNFNRLFGQIRAGQPCSQSHV
jgi:TatD DNase family protein